MFYIAQPPLYGVKQGKKYPLYPTRQNAEQDLKNTIESLCLQRLNQVFNDTKV